MGLMEKWGRAAFMLAVFIGIKVLGEKGVQAAANAALAYAGIDPEEARREHDVSAAVFEAHLCPPPRRKG